MFELVKILETALETREKGMKWFDAYCKNHDEECYNMSVGIMAHAEGLLEAYEILTGNEIRLSMIEQELKKY